MIPHHFRRRAIAATCSHSAALLLTAVLAGPLVHAQADVSAPVAIDLPAASLDQALNQLARQSGAQILFASDIAINKSAPALKGNYTVRQALQQLLEGSGLAVQMQGDKTFTVVPASGDDARVLKAVNVRAAGEVDGSAAEGYRSNVVSAVGPWQGRSLQDTPYSISVIPSDLIENLQATSPDQLYRISPTMQLSRPQYENDQPGVYMRGFNVGGQYRDGLPGDQYGHGISMEDVDRVEIFSGLSGFLYGPGNVGGMINYISKRPTAERFNRVTVGNSGGESYYAHGDFGGPIDSDGRFGYRVNAVYQDGDTAIDNQDIEKKFLSGAFDWHVTEQLLWQFDAGYRDYKVLGGQANWYLAPGVERPSADDIDTSKSWGQKWASRHYETYRYGTQLRWDASEALTLRTAWQYNNSERNTGGSSNEIQTDGTYTQTIYDLYASGDNPKLSEQYDTRGNAFADIRFDTAGVEHKLTSGVQYQHSVQKRNENYSPQIVYTGLTLARPTYFAKPAQPHTDRGARGTVSDYAYTTWLMGDDVTFNEQWSMLAGAAYSTIDSRRITMMWPTDPYKKSAVSPNFSLVYKPLETLTTYVSYIESLEQGGAASDQYNGQTVVNAGQVMEPLISKQIEIGAKWSVGNMLLTTALFEIDKGLEYYDLANPAAPKYTQDGRQVHRGIEFTAIGRAADDLTVSGGLTLLDAKVKEQKQSPDLEGKQPSGTAEKVAKLRVEYALPALRALNFSASVSYIGPQYVDQLNTDRLPGYTLVDMGARYMFVIAQHPVTLRLDVNNITDKAYWSQDGSLGDPRTVLLSASIDF